MDDIPSSNVTTAGSDVEAGLFGARWRRLVPIVFITYSLAYLDRSNYSLGAAGGLTKSLHISSGMAGLLGGLFFAGYFLFQIPAAHYAENRSVRRLVFWCVLGWGVFATAQGLIPWLWLLMVDRFLLGVVEAAIIPAMLIFLLHWFREEERGRANTFLILGNPVTVLWMSVLSGYLIGWTSWRWMFVLEGLPAIVWAFVFRAVVQDRPEQAGWLDDADRNALRRDLEAAQRRLPRVGGYLDAFRSRNVAVLALQYALWSVGVYGFVFWLPTIIKSGSKHGIGSIGALSAVPYAFAIVAMVVLSIASDRSGRRRAFVWPPLLVGAAAFYASYAVGTGHVWLSYALLVVAGASMYAPYGPYFALVPEFLPQSVAGAAMALINSAGAVGGFAGTYVVGWLTGVSDSVAFLFMGASQLLAALVMLLVRDRKPEDATDTADADRGSFAAGREDRVLVDEERAALDGRAGRAAAGGSRR
jgi:sugar phosphate permease